MKKIMFLILAVFMASCEKVIIDNADETTSTDNSVNAPFVRNRSTEYSGNLFSAGGEMSISVNSDWSDPFIGEW